MTKFIIAAALFIVSILALPASAQVAVAPLELVRQQFLSSTGVPLANGCLTFNATGTSTPQAIYVDSAGVIQAPNPYQLDAAGESNVWLSNIGYDLTVYAGVPNTLCSISLGAQQWQQKNINPFAIINGGANFIIASSTSDPSGVPGELAYRSDIPCFRGFTTLWDCFVMQNLTQTLTNKTLTSPTINGGTVNNATLNNAAVNGTFSIIVANASVTGTVLNSLAKLTGSPSTAVVTAITDTAGSVGIVIAGAGTAGNATIQNVGLVNCNFDAATTAGDYVVFSPTVAGDCHDVPGGGFPLSGQVMGRTLSTNGAAGLYQLFLFTSEDRSSASVMTFPSVVYSTPAAATNASIGATTMVTVGASNATYQFSWYANITIIGTSCTGEPEIGPAITFQDPNASASTTVGLATAGAVVALNNNGALGPIYSMLAPSNFPSQTYFISYQFRAKASTAIQYSVPYTAGFGCAPNPTVQFFPILEQLTAN